MPKSYLKKTMQGAFVLTVASFIAKLLSAVYRVPYQNLVGDEGFYAYQQVYPIYGIAMTLALSGLPQFISKIVAENRDPKDQQETLEQLYPIVFWGSISLCLLILLLSPTIASAMGDDQLVTLIQVSSLTFLFVPVLSFYRGRFQGHLLMGPTAVSQVMEQLLRVSIILIAATFFKNNHWDIYQTGTLAMAGALCGGLIAWRILKHYSGKVYGRKLQLSPWHVKINGEFCKKFIVEGGITTLYTGFLIIFQLIDSFFVSNGLQFSGVTEQNARILKGVYDRGQPLVQLGLVVAMALSSTFLPTLTKYLSAKNHSLFYKSAEMYLRLTTGIAFASAFGLSTLLPVINFTLFKDESGNLALMLFVMSVAIMAVIQCYQSIHQSRGKYQTAWKAAGIGILGKLSSTWLLTAIAGINGASMSTLLGLLLTLFYFMYHEKIGLNLFWQVDSFGRKLFFSLFCMVGSLLLFQGVVVLAFINESRIVTLLMSISGVIIGASVFIMVALRIKLFTLREWLLLPFGKKILRFLGGKDET